MLRTVILSAALSLTAISASADGQISFTVNPTNQKEDALIRFGLAAYMLHKDYETNGQVTQNGINNAAGLYQNGACNTGLIEQNGSGHTGTLSQNGCNNAHGLFQSGNNSNAHVSQSGGQSGLTFVYGF
ncbi:curlin [Pelagovum pacificum]|uniref:Curlin n=1 Tax=Pelagovum pacificum TaxID=2588711 RepID=A0A5C5GH39_9RHOB|nr:curlin [Pelagovum pacificum]QQA43299.1 hypothetical protein I8N54_01635 [Pelagovum pacificum]TNY33564.1 curlin [Pelagovum pacificum]